MFRFYNIRKESLIDRVKRKEWEKALQSISDADIISINEDPLGNNKRLDDKSELSQSDNQNNNNNDEVKDNGGQEGTEKQV